MSTAIIPTEDKIKMAARMYTMRDTAKRILGPKYADQMKDLGKAIGVHAARTGKEVLPATIDLCKSLGLEGVDLLLTIAACVELTELST